jgi:hypothetical protein
MALNIQNRRKQERHQYTEAVTLCPEGLSQVIDICSGGISFKCCCERCLITKWKVDIVDSCGIHLQELPVEKVWESVEDKKNDDYIYKTAVGVKFKDLSPEQASALYQLIHNFDDHRNSDEIMDGISFNEHPQEILSLGLPIYD